MYQPPRGLARRRRNRAALPRMMALDYGNPGFGNPFASLQGLGSQGIIGALGVGAMVAEKLPGYDSIQSQFQRFNIDLGTVTTWMMIATAFWTVWNLITRNAYTLLDTYYCCSIRITSEDTLFHDLFSWLREERAADISTARACDARKQLEFSDQGDHVVDQYGSPYIPPPTLYAGRQPSQVVYNPTPGALYHFRHNGHTIMISRETIHDPIVMQGQPLREAVQLKYYGRSPSVLKAVLDDVILRSNKRDHGKTVVYQGIVGPHGNRWERCTSRPNRPISTVILEEDQKEKVVEDIEEYLLPATAKWYANRGLPYRRGYLLYGPPGTGKTSLSMALAGHFNLEVYSLSLNAQNLNDDNLGALFALLPKSCIVLLEDVDASGVKRGEEAKTSEPETNGMNHHMAPFNPYNFTPMKSKVSFSGLINAIDGAAAKEGRILIMTTNHRERLDEALIRPGRVDLQIAFSFASKSVIAELFENLYDVTDDDISGLYMPADFPGRKEILELAREFSDLVPEGRFTPAEIQGLLLLYKKNPRAALSIAPSWVERKLAGREAKPELKASINSS